MDAPRGKRIAGLRVLVAGGSKGIGRAVGERLVSAGASVALVARTEGPLREAAEAMGAEAVEADASTAEGVARIVERTQSIWGETPDVIVNAAGAFHLAPFAATTPEQFRAVLQTNLVAPFLVIRAFLPLMLERGSGQIINVGSIAGRVALPGNAAYGASKFGLRGMHEVLTAEIRGSGVRATLIDPAATDTPLWDPIDPDSRTDLPSRTDMLRPEEVAEAVYYITSRPPGVEIPTLSIQAAG